MKHADDQVNERLRKALTDRFKILCDEPDPALSKIIFNSIQSRNRFARPVGFALMAFLTICVSIAVDDQKIRSGVLRPVANRTQMKAGKVDTGSADADLQKPVNRRVRKSISPKPERIISPSPWAGSGVSETRSPHTIPSLAISNTQTINGLERINNLPLRGYISMQMPDIAKPGKQPVWALQKKNWNILIGFSPMNTFQVVRVTPQQQTAYQNFSFPTNFTREKMAYKSHAGIEHRGFQFLLHYSQVSQSFDYELATKDFILDNHGNPIRKGLHKERDARLHLVGAGLRKNFEFNSLGLKDVFISTGLDFSRELSSKQNAQWATIGAGKQIRLNHNTSLLAGPYVEYSLHKWATHDAGLRVQPYQVGFSMIIKYKINHKK
jgi:hypothetical protein